MNLPPSPAFFCALVAALFCPLIGSCGGESAPSRPNLLFISIDTLRADALRKTVGPEQTPVTPFLDEFAEQCITFGQAWSHSPKTSPSHMTMFTGLPPRVHGVGNQQTSGNRILGPNTRTLAETLQRAGYRTGAVTSGGNVAGKLGFERGFEIYNQQPHADGLRGKLGEADEWITSVADEDPEQPWFFFFHTYSIHDPYLPPVEFQEPFVDAAYDGEIIGDKELLQYAIDNEDDRAKKESLHAKIVRNYWARVNSKNPQDLRHLSELYTAGVAHMDSELGPFLAGLESSGMLDNTVIILTSDHGEEFGEHGMLRHQQLWNENLHVPLLVRLPDAAEGGTLIDAPVRHMDIMPSLLEILDVSGPEVMLGESWAPWLGDPETIDPTRLVFSETRSFARNPLDLWSVRKEGRLVIKSHRTEQPLYFESYGDSAVGTDAGQPVLEDSAASADLMDLWRRELGRFQALVSQFGAGPGSELDPETRAELEALGYL
ncbi:MAG: arylsulfatase A-like enzyme [Planctomycetota bacterium]|jgi:arylsulfatase A-like enzyme